MEWSRGWSSPDGPAASKRWQLNVKQMCDQNLHIPLPQRLTKEACYYRLNGNVEVELNRLVHPHKEGIKVQTERETLLLNQNINQY